MWWKSKINKLLSTLAFLLLTANSIAQSADAAFDNAGQEYINGSKQLAKELVQAALQVYPGDQKLTSLLAKIEEEQEQEKQDQKDKQEGDNKDQEEKKDEEQQEDQQNQEDQKKDDQKDGEGDQSKEDEQKEGQQPKSDNISKEDAERLLKALNKEEQDIQKKVNAKKMKGKVKKTEKDW